MPYHLLNLGNQQRDVRVDFYMTQDGNLILSGNVQLEHQGNPINTMRANGTDPDTAYPAMNPAERQGSIYFELPNDSTLMPSGSSLQFGFVVSHVSSISDWQPNNTRVPFTRTYTVN